MHSLHLCMNFLSSFSTRVKNSRVGVRQRAMNLVFRFSCWASAGQFIARRLQFEFCKCQIFVCLPSWPHAARNFPNNLQHRHNRIRLHPSSFPPGSNYRLSWADSARIIFNWNKKYCEIETGVCDALLELFSRGKISFIFYGEPLKALN